jgi:hypothetical protein
VHMDTLGSETLGRQVGAAEACVSLLEKVCLGGLRLVSGQMGSPVQVILEGIPPSPLRRVVAHSEVLDGDRRWASHSTSQLCSAKSVCSGLGMLSGHLLLNGVEPVLWSWAWLSWNSAETPRWR